MATKRKAPKGRTEIRRPLGGTEKIYWLLDKLYSLNFTAYVELELRGEDAAQPALRPH